MRKLIALALLGLACSPLMAAECSATVEASDAITPTSAPSPAMPR
jgi:hypothetical protein